MLRYILKRIGYSILTLWVLVTLTFLLMHLLPGDPFVGQRAIPENIRQSLYQKYGLDKPLYVQYIKYLGNTLHGDFGDSLQYKNRPVTGIILQAFPYSFDLGLRALIFATIAGVCLGTIAAIKHGKKWDTATMIIAVIGVSVPGFIMGALLQYGISLKLTKFIQWAFNTDFKLLPISGWRSASHKILPPFALGLASLATMARLMRTSMLDVIGQDYIKTAKAKGLNKFAITWHHSIRNAILPVITVLGPIAAAILTGAFVIENVFNIPGMGKFFVQSVQTNDYPMITGTTIFYGAFLIIANMIVDIVYGFVDPRIRLADEKR